MVSTTLPRSHPYTGHVLLDYLLHDILIDREEVVLCYHPQH